MAGENRCCDSRGEVALPTVVSEGKRREASVEKRDEGLKSRVCALSARDLRAEKCMKRVKLGALIYCVLVDNAKTTRRHTDVMSTHRLDQMYVRLHEG